MEHAPREAPNIGQNPTDSVEIPKERTPMLGYRSREAAGKYVHRFRVDGRAYTLYKREQTHTGPWYFALRFRSRRIQRSTDTSVQATATTRAMMLIRKIRSERWLEVDEMRERHGFCRIGDIIEVYQQAAALQVKPHTLRGNVNYLRRMLRIALEVEAVDDQSSSVLTGKLVRQFKEKYLGQRLHGVATVEMDRQRAQAQLTGNSTLRQARSVFNRHMLEVYSDRGLRLPALAEFVHAPGYKSVGIEYRPASDEVVAATFDQIEDLRESDRNLYLSFWLAVGCGLRKGEISRARWDWFQQRNSTWWIATAELGKDGMRIEVPVLGDAWQRIQPLVKPAGAVLEGSPSEVQEVVFRRIGEWMERLGWESEKRIHELRAWVGSKIAEQHGMEAASRFLRHKNLSTTQRFYTRYLKLKAIDITLPAVGLGQNAIDKLNKNADAPISIGKT